MLVNGDEDPYCLGPRKTVRNQRCAILVYLGKSTFLTVFFFLFLFFVLQFQDRGESDYRKTTKKKNRQGSTSSGPDKEKENATDDEDHHIKRAASRDSVASEFSDRAFHIQNTASSVPLVKVLLPDLSSAVIAARPGQSVQQLLSKLLDRRGLRFNAFELYDSHSAMTVELERDASVLGGMEIRLEPRVVFHLLLLQSGKSLMIRGQPRRQLGEVVKPILLKYGLKIEHSIIVKSATGDVVPTKTLLASLDSCHLKVRHSLLTRIADDYS